MTVIKPSCHGQKYDALRTNNFLVEFTSLDDEERSQLSLAVKSISISVISPDEKYSYVTMDFCDFVGIDIVSFLFKARKSKYVEIHRFDPYGKPCKKIAFKNKGSQLVIGKMSYNVDEKVLHSLTIKTILKERNFFMEKGEEDGIQEKQVNGV